MTIECPSAAAGRYFDDLDEAAEDARRFVFEHADRITTIAAALVIRNGDQVYYNNSDIDRNRATLIDEAISIVWEIAGRGCDPETGEWKP